MVNTNVFSAVQIILAIILVGLILLQAKGAGLGSTFGGGMGLYQTRRGVERILFIMTVVVATLFLIISILGLIL